MLQIIWFAVLHKSYKEPIRSQSERRTTTPHPPQPKGAGGFARFARLIAVADAIRQVDENKLLIVTAGSASSPPINSD